MQNAAGRTVSVGGCTKVVRLDEKIQTSESGVSRLSLFGKATSNHASMGCLERCSPSESLAHCFLHLASWPSQRTACRHGLCVTSHITWASLAGQSPLKSEATCSVAPCADEVNCIDHRWMFSSPSVHTIARDRPIKLAHPRTGTRRLSDSEPPKHPPRIVVTQWKARMLWHRVEADFAVPCLSISTYMPG